MFDLTSEQQLIQATARSSPRPRSAPSPPRSTATRASRTRRSSGWASSDSMGIAIPEQWGGSGAGAVAYVGRARRDRSGVREPRRGHVGQQLALRRPALRGSAPTLSASSSCGRSPPVTRTDASRSPSRRRAPTRTNQATLGRARRRSLRAQRPQALHHERARGVVRARVLPDRSRRRATTASPPSWSRRARRASRWQRPRTSSASAPPTRPSCVFDDCRVPAREPHRRRGAGIQDRHDGGRRRAHRHRRPGGRHRGRRLRALGGVRARAQGLRRADRRAPDGPVDAGRHGDVAIDGARLC